MPKKSKTSSTASGSGNAPKNMKVDDCAANLTRANKACAFETEEKEKRVTELLAANQKVADLNDENTRVEAELVIARKELVVEKKAKRKQAQANTDENLKNAKASQKAHIKDLQEMMFITSHQLRSPVAQILGLANILDSTSNSPAEVNEIVEHMKESAETLDDMTKELTSFIHNQEVKARTRRPKK